MKLRSPIVRLGLIAALALPVVAAGVRVGMAGYARTPAEAFTGVLSPLSEMSVQDAYLAEFAGVPTRFMVGASALDPGAVIDEYVLRSRSDGVFPLDFAERCRDEKLRRVAQSLAPIAVKNGNFASLGYLDGQLRRVTITAMKSAPDARTAVHVARTETPVFLFGESADLSRDTTGVPLPPGARRTFAMSRSGAAGGFAAYEVDLAAEEVVKFYRRTVEEKGWSQGPGEDAMSREMGASVLSLCRPDGMSYLILEDAGENRTRVIVVSY